MPRRDRPPLRSTVAWHRARAAELAEVRRIVSWMREHRGYGWLVTMERDGVMSEELPSEWARGVSRPRAAYLEKLRQYAESFGYVREAPAALVAVGDSLLREGRSPSARAVDILREDRSRSVEGQAATRADALASLSLISSGDSALSGPALVAPPPFDPNVPTPCPRDGGRVGEESSREDAYVDVPTDPEDAGVASSRKDAYAVPPSAPDHAQTKHNTYCASIGAGRTTSGPEGQADPRDASTERLIDGRDGGSPGPDPRRGGGGANAR